MCVGYKVTYVYPDGQSQTHIDYTPCELKENDRPCWKARIEDRGLNYVPGVPSASPESPNSPLLGPSQAATMSQVAGPLVVATPNGSHMKDVASPIPRHRTRRSSYAHYESEDRDKKKPGFFTMLFNKDPKSEKKHEELKSSKKRQPKPIETNSVVLHERSYPASAHPAPPPHAPEPPNAADTGLTPPLRRASEAFNHSPTGGPYYWDPHLAEPEVRYEVRVPMSRRQSQRENTNPVNNDKPGILKNGNQPLRGSESEVTKSRVYLEKDESSGIRVLGDDPELPYQGESRDQARERLRAERRDQETQETDAARIARIQLELNEVKAQLRLTQAELAQNVALQKAATNAAEVRAAQLAEDRERENANQRRLPTAADATITDYTESYGEVDKYTRTRDVEEMTHKFAEVHTEDRRKADPPRRTMSTRGPERPSAQPVQNKSSSDPTPVRQRQGSQQYAMVGAREHQQTQELVRTSDDDSRRSSGKSHHHARKNTTEDVPDLLLPGETDAPNARYDPNSDEINEYEKLYFNSRQQWEDRKQHMSEQKSTQQTPSETHSSSTRKHKKERTPTPEPTPYAPRPRRHHRRHGEGKGENRHSYPSRIHHHTGRTPSPDNERNNQRSGNGHSAYAPRATYITNSSTGSSKYREYETSEQRTVRRSNRASDDLRGEYGSGSSSSKNKGKGREDRSTSSRTPSPSQLKAPIAGATRRPNRGDGSAPPKDRPATWWM